jgi:GntR family transcriptional regulator
VIAIDRLAFVDGLPIVFIQAYLCLALGRKLLADAPLLERNTIASLLKDRHGVAVDSVVQTIGASLADPSFAHHLGLEVGAPVLEGERTYYDPGGRPILVSLAFYRADRHRFAVTLKQWR